MPAKPPTAVRRRSGFNALVVRGVEPLTEDSVVVSFTVPVSLREAYSFTPGQHITLRRGQAADGSELRRSYSLCSTPAELAESGVLRIGVRQIPSGAFSGYATTSLAPGEHIDVMAPLGHFTTQLDPARGRHYAALAAGSGITPILSLMATALAVEPRSRFTLLYCNRRSGTVMFAEAIADLKDRYPDRLHVVHVLTREGQMSALLSGRVDGVRLREILDSGLIDSSTVDEWFLCGPFGMVTDAQGVLTERGHPEGTVHTELFHVEDTPAQPRSRAEEAGEASVTITLEGRESTFTMSADERILDAALRLRPELPYACKGGVCSTCRARLLEGRVEMAHNYSLEPDEVAAGYILTCQASPASPQLVVDYDA